MPQTIFGINEQMAAYVRGTLAAALSQVTTQPSILIGSMSALVLEVQENGRIFGLNEPLYIPRFSESGLIYYQFKPLSILAYGSSERAALASFYEDFGALWDCIAQATDASLTPEAIEVKRRFQRVVN